MKVEFVGDVSLFAPVLLPVPLSFSCCFVNLPHHSLSDFLAAACAADEVDGSTGIVGRPPYPLGDGAPLPPGVPPLWKPPDVGERIGGSGWL